MQDETRSAEGSNWLEASGLRHIVRVLGFAVDPGKLGIAAAAIVLTFLFGGALDLLWKGAGGVDEAAVGRFTIACRSGKPYEEPKGDLGISHVWWQHQRSCVYGLLGTSVPGSSSLVAGAGVGALAQSHARMGPIQNLVGMGYGIWWLISEHFFYFLAFGVGCLLIWSWAGGAVCRIAALQFAGDEKPTMGQAHAFSCRHLLGGFLPAPLIPIIAAAIVALFMILGGAFLRIPIAGDILAGTAFPLALMGGFIIATLIVGTLVGGSLFWPSIAVEGQDAYDAFSRGLSYAFSRPWKTVLYGVITLVYAGICWILVNLFVYFALAITRSVVAFGTSPFGWWPRGSEDAPVSKMDLLWSFSGADGMFAWPQWGQLAWYEHYSSFVIGIFVLLTIALMWGFLAAFYFSGSTVVYFLLRRDVDGTDIEEVKLDDGDEPESGGASASAAGGESGGGVSLPVVTQPAAGAAAVPAPSAEKSVKEVEESEAKSTGGNGADAGDSDSTDETPSSTDDDSGSKSES